MIVEFALTISLAVSPVTPVEFSEPVREVITYPDTGVVNQLSGLPLPDGTAAAYQENFLEGLAYFGAFAITKDFAYGYVTGANSIEAAREIALEECYTQAPNCLLYAEIYPEGYVPLAPGQISLSAAAASRFNSNNPEWGDYRAMAVSEDGAFSVVWNYGSPREASAAALEDCSLYVTNDLPNLRVMPCMLIPFK